MGRNSHRPGSKCPSKKRTHIARGRLAAQKRWTGNNNATEETPPTEGENNMAGRRIMEVEKLCSGVETISEHSAECSGVCHMIDEKQDGLASTFTLECNKCNQTFCLDSSSKIKGSGTRKNRHAVNVGAVWGQMITGGGHSNLAQFSATLELPQISSNTFTSIEEQIGKAWEKQLAEEMTKAGEEEKKIAINNNSYFQGIPAISVTVDGGWSKRSHKHSYSAKSGVALIIGNATKQILYLGVRNKYCSVCAVANNKGATPQNHQCYKNWDGSSSSMETDILVEGFRAAESMHGVRYMKMIGDGDSSVLTNIQTCVPGWGVFVTKVECANHAVKCYRNRLEKIVQDFPNYKGKGKLTQRAIKRLTNGARCAIKINSTSGTIDQLRKDLRNCPNHVFNDHTNCSSSFCKVAAVSEASTSDTQVAPTSDTQEPYVTPPTSDTQEAYVTPPTSDIQVAHDEHIQIGDSRVDTQFRGDTSSSDQPNVDESPIPPRVDSSPPNPTSTINTRSTSSASNGRHTRSTSNGRPTTNSTQIPHGTEICSVEEEAREGDNTFNRIEIPDDLYFRVQRAGDRLVSNATSLIANSTSNLAECYMGIRCKFDGGKVLNRVQRGSFQHRCNGAGLRFQLGPDWAPQAWQYATGEEPGKAMSKFYTKQAELHKRNMKRKGESKYKEARKKAR